MQTAGHPIRTDKIVLNATAHGISLTNNVPVPVYIDVNTSQVQLANAIDENDSTEQKAFFVVKVLDADNILIQQSGFVDAVGHNLAIANYYWLDPSNPGQLTDTMPSSPNSNDVCLYVISADKLLLIDNRRL